MGRLWFLVWIVCCWLVVPSLAAAATEQPLLRVFRLDAGEAPPSDVLAGRFDASAAPMPGPMIAPIRFVGGWWRLDVARDIPREPLQVLVLDAPNHTESAAWLPGQAGPMLRATTGPHADPTFGPRLAVFPLPDGLRAGQHVYLHVTTSTRIAESLRIVGEKDLRMQDRRDLAINTLIQGTLLALVLIGVGLGWILRESGFLMLGCGLGFALLYLMDATAELYRLPGLAPLADLYFLQGVLGTLAAIFTALFLLGYLQMKSRAPWLARVQYAMLAVYFVVLAGRLIPGIGLWSQWSNIGNLAMLVSTMVGLAVGIRGAFAGHRPSRVFLWSWLPLLTFLTWRIVEITFGWVASPLLQYAFPASFVLAGVLLMIGMTDRMLQYKRERDASDVLAHRDPLTGVYNRRALDERLHAAALETGDHAQTLALLFVDLDHFKRVNDEHGHGVGDECLREVARRLRTSLRFGDVLGRYGGEEFVIGLPHMNLHDAAAMGERVRLAVASVPIASGGREVAITISIGVAVLHDGLAGFDAAMQRADRALYASKRDGRNRVSVLAA